MCGRHKDIDTRKVVYCMYFLNNDKAGRSLMLLEDDVGATSHIPTLTLAVQSSWQALAVWVLLGDYINAPQKRMLNEMNK
jgi:hypothetical protein